MSRIKDDGKAWMLTLIGFVVFRTLVAAGRGRIVGSGVRWRRL